MTYPQLTTDQRQLRDLQAEMTRLPSLQCKNCSRVHYSLDDLGYCSCRRKDKLVKSTNWGPPADTFNGMVQLIVSPLVVQRRLRDLGAEFIEENALEEQQCGHHVTLAFKPTNGELENLMLKFDRVHTVSFRPKEVRANPGICAVFGDVVRHDREDNWIVPGSHHITLGAAEGVSPVESKKLEPIDMVVNLDRRRAAWERYADLPKWWLLLFNVHPFQGS